MLCTPRLVCAVFLLAVSYTLCQNSANAATQSYFLEVHLIKETSSRLRVIWFVREGDLSIIAGFQFTLTSHLGRALIDSKLGKTQRSIGLHPMSLNARYTVTIKALDSEGGVLAQKEAPVTEALNDSSDVGIFLRASEIRPMQARLAWALKNVDPKQVKNIRLYVEREGDGGPQIVQRMLSPVKRTFLFSRIHLYSHLCVTVEAIGHDDKPFLNSALFFQSAELQGYGEPITGSALPQDRLLDECCERCRWPPLEINPN